MSPARPVALALLAALLLALVACASSSSRSAAEAADQPPLPEGPRGRIEGTVFDVDGSPIQGCRITLYHSGLGRKWHAQADEDGRFLLVDLPVLDEYKLTLSTPPFWTTTLRHISVRVGEATRLDVVRRLEQGGGPLTPGSVNR